MNILREARGASSMQKLHSHDRAFEEMRLNIRASKGVIVIR